MKRAMFVLVWLLVICGLWPSKWFWYYENNMYCKLSPVSIVISLNKKDGALCNTYIRSLEIAMKNTYLDMVSIQKFIDSKQDLWYRNPLKDEKTKYLSSLQTVRLKIMANMTAFEQSLLTKTKKYFLDSLVVYQQKLKTALTKIGSSSDIQSIDYKIKIKQQLANIDYMSGAKTFETFALNFQKYLTLKDQLVWK